MFLKGTKSDHIVLFMFANAVANGVLNQRLEKEAGHEEREQALIDFHCKSKTVAKPSLLNASVMLEKLNFPAERNFLGTGIIQGNAQ